MDDGNGAPGGVQNAWASFGEVARSLLPDADRDRLADLERRWPRERLDVHRQSTGWHRAMGYAGYEGRKVEPAPWLPEHDEMFALRHEAGLRLFAAWEAGRYELEGRRGAAGHMERISASECRRGNAGNLTAPLPGWRDVMARVAGPKPGVVLTARTGPSTASGVSDAFGAGSGVSLAGAGRQHGFGAWVSGPHGQMNEGLSVAHVEAALRQAEDERRRAQADEDRRREMDRFWDPLSVPLVFPSSPPAAPPRRTAARHQDVPPGALSPPPSWLPLPAVWPAEGLGWRAAVAMLLPSAERDELVALYAKGYPRGPIGSLNKGYDREAEARAEALAGVGWAALWAGIEGGDIEVTAYDPERQERRAVPRDLRSLMREGTVYLRLEPLPMPGVPSPDPRSVSAMLTFSPNGRLISEVDEDRLIYWREVRVMAPSTSVGTASATQALPPPPTARKAVSPPGANEHFTGRYDPKAYGECVADLRSRAEASPDQRTIEKKDHYVLWSDRLPKTAYRDARQEALAGFTAWTAGGAKKRKP
ncbi:hypothetical protein [Teichococcus aerofrigidensis]